MSNPDQPIAWYDSRKLDTPVEWGTRPPVYPGSWKPLYAHPAGDAIRDAALEAAAKACEGEQVEGTGHDGDIGYNLAIEHCAAAIRALRGRTA